MDGSARNPVLARAPVGPRSGGGKGGTKSWIHIFRGEPWQHSLFEPRLELTTNGFIFEVDDNNYKER